MRRWSKQQWDYGYDCGLPRPEVSRVSG